MIAEEPGKPAEATKDLSEDVVPPEDSSEKGSGAGARTFPRIMWVQTDHELEAKAVEEAFPAYNQMHFGREDGFEVRVVNNLNAYDWLSEEMTAFVRQARHESRAELPVYDLLRLALLYEHGGVTARAKVLLLRGLAWVEDLMEGRVDVAGEKVLSCKRAGTKDVIVIHESRKDGPFYRDDFLAARPRARLLGELLNATRRVAREAKWPYAQFNPTQVDRNT